MAYVLLLLACVTGSLAANVLDVLKARKEHTALELIQAAGLETTLTGAGPFTIFAPTESAFHILGSSVVNNLKNDTTRLSAAIKYHVVMGNLSTNDLMVNEMMLDSLSGKKIRVNYYMYNRHISVEGARVIGNFRANNGIVHLVTRVLSPPEGSITDILSTNPNLSMLKTAVDTAGLNADLADGPYTLLAPTNSAFNRLGNDTVQALLGSPELLKSVLLYHVLHGTLYSTGMHSGSLHTLEEADREILTSSFGGYLVRVDGARVTQKDVSATNGVLHMVDHVLIPNSLRLAIANLNP